MKQTYPYNKLSKSAHLACNHLWTIYLYVFCFKTIFNLIQQILAECLLNTSLCLIKLLIDTIFPDNQSFRHPPFADLRKKPLNKTQTQRKSVAYYPKCVSLNIWVWSLNLGWWTATNLLKRCSDFRERQTGGAVPLCAVNMPRPPPRGRGDHPELCFPGEGWDSLWQLQCPVKIACAISSILHV